MSLSVEWNVVQREAQLAAEQVAGGITALGRANHAQTGYYFQAFFGLANGLERLGKLVFVSDHTIRNAGRFPDNQNLRAIGHDIEELMSVCAKVGATLDPNRKYARKPEGNIHAAIQEVLSDFAKSTRYFNLDLLSNTRRVASDPIAAWWERVVQPILERHYTPTLRARGERRWRGETNSLNAGAFVLHHDESGDEITDVKTMATRALETGYAQRWGRMYTLQIVRWLASILHELSNTGAYDLRIQPLLGLHEPFRMFLNDDDYLRRRRTWSIYRL